jgi:hypothetical protein
VLLRRALRRSPSFVVMTSKDAFHNSLYGIAEIEGRNLSNLCRGVRHVFDHFDPTQLSVAVEFGVTKTKKKSMLASNECCYYTHM